jgi:predicted RNase H-like HicB family nuclease
VKYDVVIERDRSGAWLAGVPSVRGCHTYGRTLGQTRERIREALSLWVDDAASAELVFDVRLPAKIRTELERAHTARERSSEAASEAQEALRAAAADLTSSLALSRRDAAELLGLSHQRVQQLLEG